MHTIRILLAVTTIALAGCAMNDLDYDPNDDMTPLKGAGEKPTIRNRFPERRGGFPLSRADREDRDMTPMERLKQY
jgi:hypothetical protein